MTPAAFDLNRLIRSNISQLEPYTPILPFEVLSQQLGRRPETIIKLDANENPYGPSPLVAEALAEAPHLHIYPDPESRLPLANRSPAPGGRESRDGPQL